MRRSTSNKRSIMNHILPPSLLVEDAKTNFRKTIRHQSETTTDQLSTITYNFFGNEEFSTLERTRLKRVPESQPVFRRTTRLTDNQITRMVRDQMKRGDFNESQEPSVIIAQSFLEGREGGLQDKIPSTTHRNLRTTSMNWNSQNLKRNMPHVYRRGNSKEREEKSALATHQLALPPIEYYTGKQVIDSLKLGKSLKYKKPQIEVIDSQMKSLDYKIRQSGLNQNKSQNEKSPIQKFSRVHNKEIIKNPFPKFAYHLPSDLQLNLQTFNDFYKNKERGKKAETHELSSSEYRKSLFGSFSKVVRKVQAISRIGKEMKDIQRKKAEDRYRQSLQEESNSYNIILNKLKEKVVENMNSKLMVEGEVENSQLDTSNLNVDYQNRRGFHFNKIRRKSKIPDPDSPHLKPKLLDVYSVRKTTGLKPYKSYWLKCVEDCFKTVMVFDTKIVISIFNIGYYRVVFQKKQSNQPEIKEAADEFVRRPSHMNLEEESFASNTKNLQTAFAKSRIQYTFLKDENRYYFEFDSLLRILGKNLEPSETNILESNSSLNQDSRVSEEFLSSGIVEGTSSRQDEPYSLNSFLDMYSKVEQDIMREYSLLFPEES